jgi:hypothetical protein
MPPHESFAEFWKSYPRREAKKVAFKVWLKLKPDAELLDRILTALEWQREKPQWTKDGGQYVPLPASWLNGERWTDEPPHIEQPVDRTSWSDWKAAHLGKPH